MKRLLKVRRRLKSRKPEFRRHEAHKKLRLRDKSWRRPRGLHNKLREKRAGKKPVMIGFGSPAKVRGLHPSGFEEVLVYNPSDLEKINPKKQAARIASSVGLKKRLMIEERARELNITILNPTQR
ncbi:50S ribosomal protein L32e [Candidatus Bathyarchaeota archaeon]|nr:MAG: 50S ribosomal protein L32e [Candidatus Bathyarchaeota archaeon]